MYYEYWVDFYNDMDSILENRSGVVFADSLYEAFQTIASYYGEEIVNVEIREADEDACFECELDRETEVVE